MTAFFSDKGKIGIFTQTFFMVNLRQKDRPKAGIYTNYSKSKGKPAILMALALLLILMMAIVFNPNRGSKKMVRNQNNVPAAAASEPDFVKQGELTFLKADSTVIVKIDIEIADDDLKRERGLMYRRQMELGHGMLFIFPEEDQRSFWMRNTYLPLDIMYLDANRKIVRIHENVATLNDQPILSDFPAKYVVEVNAGFCALNNIQVGDRMTFLRK
jgi:uncharacterized protein